MVKISRKAVVWQVRYGGNLPLKATFYNPESRAPVIGIAHAKISSTIALFC
jgi:hypothetical protein